MFWWNKRHVCDLSTTKIGRRFDINIHVHTHIHRAPPIDVQFESSFHPVFIPIQKETDEFIFFLNSKHIIRINLNMHEMRIALCDAKETTMQKRRKISGSTSNHTMPNSIHINYKMQRKLRAKHTHLCTHTNIWRRRSNATVAGNHDQSASIPCEIHIGMPSNFVFIWNENIC